MDEQRLRELVEVSDLDGLVRFVDGLVAVRDWNGLVAVRDRCLEAVGRGKQVWGAAEFAEYRLALDAPAPYALAVVRPGAGRHAPGPLWEVAASTHTWEELAGVSDPTMRALIAHERLLRGDDLSGVEVGREIVDVPLRLCPWEPRYPVAAYRSDGVDLPEVESPPLRWVELPEAAPRREAPDVGGALVDLVRPWVDESNGRAETVAVAGTAEQAIRALGPRRARIAEVDVTAAVGVMAWAAASGGAYGRRRGTPVGRALAWWTLAVILGLDDDWPVDGAFLGEEGRTLRWLLWNPGDRTGGWALHLAVEDPDDGLAWVLSAVDAR